MLKKTDVKEKVYHFKCGLVQKKKPIFTTPDDLLQDVVLPGSVGLEVLFLLGSDGTFFFFKCKSQHLGGEAGRSLSLRPA